MLLLAVATIVAQHTLVAQDNLGPDRESIPLRLLRPVLVKVEVNGNSGLGTEQILSVVVSHPAHIPVSAEYMLYFAQGVVVSPFADSVDRAIAQEVIDSLSGQVRYVNITTVAADTLRIKELYTSYGYHDAVVGFTIAIDTALNVAILRFNIDENIRYPLRELNYTWSGSADLPADILQKVERPVTFSLGAPYSQDLLYGEIDRVVKLLRNNGYPFASLSYPPTVKMVRPPYTTEPYDIADIAIYTGARYRFGDTYHTADTSVGGRPVKDALVIDQAEYKQGEWYSRAKLDQTASNLYELGTFDLVNVELDTSRLNPETNSADIRIATRLRPQNDVRIAPELSWERRIRDIAYNFGLSAAYQRSNLLGGAERFGVNGRLQIPLFRREDVQFGGALSYYKPSNPYMWLIGSKRIGFLASTGYDYSVIDVIRRADSQSIIDVDLRQRRFNAQAEFTYRFKDINVFSRMTVRVGGQWNQYYNVRNYIDAAADTIVAQLDTLDAASRPLIRSVLAETIFRPIVLQGDDITLLGRRDSAAYRSFDAIKQTYVLGVSLIGDRRNDYFSPTSGYLVEVNSELGLSGLLGFSGIPVGRWNGGFAKIEAQARMYGTVFSNWTWAARAHSGVIVEFGPLPLTPISSRFSAGGANSIRGWNSRDMLATRADAAAFGSTEALSNDELRQIITTIIQGNRRLLGGLAVLELSFELRKQLFDFDNTSGLARLLNDFVIIPFVDAGNAYFRDREDIGVVGFVENIALAAGVSIGYNTPIGPVRVGIGFPIYDPVDLTLDASDRWIFSRPFWQLAVVHVGIGHAF